MDDGLVGVNNKRDLLKPPPPAHNHFIYIYMNVCVF